MRKLTIRSMIALSLAVLLGLSAPLNAGQLRFATAQASGSQLLELCSAVKSAAETTVPVMMAKTSSIIVTKPSNTPKPAVTPTPKPTNTPAPKPSETPKPTQAPKPSETPKPIETTKPSSTPAPTPTPVVTATEPEMEFDLSTASEGYIKVRTKIAVTTKLLAKLVKTDAGGNSMGSSYEIKESMYNDGRWMPLNLILSEGYYKIILYKHKSGTSYSAVLSSDVFQVKFKNTNSPYLCPSKEVDYLNSPNVIKKAAELTKNAKTDIDKISAVFEWIVKNVSYDKNFANEVIAGNKTGYVPTPDTTLSTKKGICYDYASLFAAMLRSQGIPAQMVKGDVKQSNGKEVYHAWNKVYTKETGWVEVNCSVAFDGKTYIRMDATFSVSNGDGSYDEYIGDGSNYTEKYIR